MTQTLREKVARAIWEAHPDAETTGWPMPAEVEAARLQADAAILVCREHFAGVAEAVPVEAFRRAFPEDEAWPELTEKVVKPVKHHIVRAIRSDGEK